MYRLTVTLPSVRVISYSHTCSESCSVPCINYSTPLIIRHVNSHSAHAWLEQFRVGPLAMPALPSCGISNVYFHEPKVSFSLAFYLIAQVLELCPSFSLAADVYLPFTADVCLPLTADVCSTHC